MAARRPVPLHTEPPVLQPPQPHLPRFFLPLIRKGTSARYTLPQHRATGIREPIRGTSHLLAFIISALHHSPTYPLALQLIPFAQLRRSRLPPFQNPRHPTP